MKKVLYIIVCVLLCSCSKEKSRPQNLIDPTVQEAMEQLRIARDSNRLSLQERKAYLNKSLALFDQVKKDSNYLTNLSQVSLVSSRLKDSLLFRQVNRKVLELSLDQKDFKSLGESHWDLGAFFRNNDKNDSAYYHFRAAYNSFAKLPRDSTSQSLEARMLFSMARQQDQVKDYLGAESNIVKGIKIFDELGDYRRLYMGYNLLGVLSNGQKNRDKALEYYRRAGTLIKDLDVPNIDNYFWVNQNNIAHVLLKKEEYAEALELYNQLLSDEKFFKEDTDLYSTALVSQTFAQSKTGVTGQQLNRQYERAIHINDSIGDLDDQGRAKQFYGELLISQGDTLKGLNYIKEAREIAEAASNNDRSLEVLRSLTTLDKENAVAYSTAYFDLSEQIKEEERTQRDKFARIRLETDEVIEENEILTRQKQIYAGITIGLLLLGIALFTIISQRISNNRLKFQQKQQESNQEIYNLMLSQQGKFEEGKKLEQKRISEELHDGVLGEMLGIRLVLSGLNEKDDEASIEHRGQLIEKLRGVEEEIRTISHELSDSSYQKIYNFIVSLDEMIQSIESSSGIGCSFSYDSHLEWDELEGDLKINAYRIVQEALQNSVKHSKCENALVNFEVEGSELKLSISDDGIGFDINKGRRGIGLRNIISRVKKVNGTLHIDSKKGEGTTIVVTFPISYTKRNDPQQTAGNSEMMNA